MRFRTILSMALYLGLCLSPQSHASTFYEEKIKCPIGGEKFSYSAHGSYSSWGRRPDGKPYGSTQFPIVPPECPSNGLIIYKDFSAAERKKLIVLLASPEFKKIREDETSYYRIAWLEKSLNPKSDFIALAYLRASWQADDTPNRKRRYVKHFIEAALSSPSKTTDNAWLDTNLLLANAYRELKQFDKAQGVVETIRAQKDLYKDLPPFDEANETKIDTLPIETKERWHMLGFLEKLAKAILRQDHLSEPLDLISTEMAAERCFFDDDSLSVQDKQICDGAEVKGEIERSKDDWAPQKVAYAKSKIIWRCVFEPETLNVAEKAVCETPEVMTRIEEDKEYWGPLKARLAKEKAKDDAEAEGAKETIQ